MSEMPLWAKISIGVAGALVLALIIAQIALPGAASGEIEDRLTEGGGTAEVDVSAFPAATLLWESGDDVEVRGSGLQLDLETPDKAFEQVDGFDEVDIELNEFSVGPVEVASFALTRSGDEPYKIEMHSTMTPADVAAVGGQAFGAGPIASLFSGLLFGNASNTVIPVDLNVEAESDDGNVNVVSGTAEVAGFDATPLAELITATIAARL